jgi:phosphatidylethanolamine/phosphatidyl-N-methylethanolamine N-methyltransferase
MSTLTYLKNFIKDRNVASIAPSSRTMVKRVCEKIDFSKDNVIVEYGPGNGVFTRYILDHSTIGSRIISIELNENFVRDLGRIRDDRFHVYHDSAENVGDILARFDITEVDYFLSGIPFSFLKKKQKDLILGATSSYLKPGGKFLAYQTSNHLKEPLRRHFPSVDLKYEIRNLPPMCLYEATKPINYVNGSPAGII